MAIVVMSFEVPAPAARIWGLVRAFERIGDWLPLVRECRMTGTGKRGSVRVLTFAGGAWIEERLVSTSDARRTQTYAMVAGSFPVSRYVSTISVAPIGRRRARLRWAATLTPAGITQGAAMALVQRVYRAGAEALMARFSGS